MSTSASGSVRSGTDGLAAAVVRIPLRLVHNRRLLSKHEFVAHLELEKRRSNRTHSPLSVALFSCEGGGREPSRGTDLARDLLVHTRDTDLLGYIDENLIALLLPHTDRQGAEIASDAVMRRIGTSGHSVRLSTYPDQLFESLAKEGLQTPNTHPLLVDGALERGRIARYLKRGMDIVGSLGLLVVTIPLLAVVAVAIRFTSPGPAVFKQIRIGQGCRPFVFYKFRSMYTCADDAIHREYVAKLIDGQLGEINQGSPTDPHYKIKEDPRVTSVGRWIRATSIDELPQLINVLKGDMSLVGPRPPLPYEVEKYRAWHLARVLDVKPGLTGLWQVEGRSSTSFDDMVRLDVKYIRHRSLWLDIKILAKTVLVVLKRDGAA